MKIDLSKLSAAELDELILDAAERRSNVQPPPPAEHPHTAPQAIVNPAWYVSLVGGGTVFQIRHPGLGWLAFIIPPGERILLMSLLLQQSLLTNPNQSESATTTSPPTADGGGLH